MPDVIDPQGTGLLRLGLGIDALLGQAFLENGIRETEVGADAAVKGVVARRDVVVAPGELPGVCCEEAGREAGVVGALEQAQGQLVIVRHVELKESGCAILVGGLGVVGAADVFDRSGARGRETVGQVELACHCGDGEFAQGVVDLIDADGSEADRG